MIDKLRELANNATQVKWSWDGRQVDDDGDVYIPECSYLVGNICLADQYDGYIEDCDFIAAANPIAISQLIQQREEILAALKGALDSVLDGDGLTHEQVSAFKRVIAKAES